jgi:hypothetical protein
VLRLVKVDRLFAARDQDSAGEGLQQADGVAFAGSGEGITFGTVIDQVTQGGAQFVEVDLALSENAGEAGIEPGAMMTNFTVHDASMHTSLSGFSLSNIKRTPFSHCDLCLDSSPRSA